MLRRIAVVLPLAFVLAAPDAVAAPSRRVFGYAQGSTMPSRWDLLTDVAYFAEPMGTTGILPTGGWRSSGMALVTAGHAHGVRVVLTVNLFNSANGTEIHTFLSNPVAVTAGTTAIVNAVKANGADGVDIDFEFVATADKALFTAFIQRLAQQMHAALPQSDVSIAMPAEGDPGYDIVALAAAADTLMIMAYDYHWSTSDPGPVAPLQSSSMWGAFSQQASIALFKGKVAQTSKLLVGMPLYGYSYHATSNGIPGTRVAGSTATSVTYASAEMLAPMYGRKWDVASSTPYYEYQDSNGWRQAFYDDSESLGLKVDQVNAEGMGGIGLWALGYESSSFWTMLEAKLGPTPDGGAGDGGTTDGSAAPDVDAGVAGREGGLGVPGGDGVLAGSSGADAGGCSLSGAPASSRGSGLGALVLAIAAALSRRRVARQ